MRWLWPLNWYLHIRQLEGEVAKLRHENEKLEHENQKLDASFRAAALSQISMTTAYTSAVASLISTSSAGR